VGVWVGARVSVRLGLVGDETGTDGGDCDGVPCPLGELPDAEGVGPLGEGGTELGDEVTDEETGGDGGPEGLGDATPEEDEGGTGALEEATRVEELDDETTDETGPPEAGGTGFPMFVGESPVYA